MNPGKYVVVGWTWGGFSWWVPAPPSVLTGEEMVGVSVPPCGEAVRLRGSPGGCCPVRQCRPGRRCWVSVSPCGKAGRLGRVLVVGTGPSVSVDRGGDVGKARSLGLDGRTLTKRMFVLGIDPGLTTTGYGAVRRVGGSLEAVAVGVIRTDAAAPDAARLAEIHRDIASVIDDLEPDAMAIERVFLNRNRSTAIGVGRASGVIMLAAADRGVLVDEYTPTTVKASVTGDGMASKIQVKQMVARRLGLATIPSPPDAADALAVALCHLQTARFALGRRPA